MAPYVNRQQTLAFEFLLIERVASLFLSKSLGPDLSDAFLCLPRQCSRTEIFLRNNLLLVLFFRSN